MYYIYSMVSSLTSKSNKANNLSLPLEVKIIVTYTSKLFKLQCHNILQQYLIYCQEHLKWSGNSISRFDAHHNSRLNIYIIKSIIFNIYFAHIHLLQFNINILFTIFIEL